MAILTRDGANLFYETAGQGPTLILIPGANGTGDIFKPASMFLKEHFTVVTYDRRGFGQSKLTEDMPQEVTDIHSTYRLKTDAADVAALAQAVSGQEQVFIMGSSSGSIVAMETLQDFPEIVKQIAFHESPINTLLPDTEKWQDINAEIVTIALTENFALGMEKFAAAMRTVELDQKMMSRPGVDLSDMDNPEVQGMDYWFRYEIRQYTSREIDFNAFKQHRNKIRLLNGTDSKGSFPQDVMHGISNYLDLPIYDIPGAHLGYIQKPEGFATTLMALFR
ncbi:alpha/beta fold hydrolase [Listeria booriae]|uniref:Alpha/beta hydrolase n=1 Tax=Listeria booriae TaxID=1552123 RepID=A0A842F491_9LIST|nr:alpha/beta hydrolase [Listeria booriae]MBC2208295.1 alpha/beta hydrolase [Listeria booriae]MBC2242165.1 alpha/beta hydrolase [Listeria booriae]